MSTVYQKEEFERIFERRKDAVLGAQDVFRVIEAVLSLDAHVRAFRFLEFYHPFGPHIKSEQFAELLLGVRNTVEKKALFEAELEKYERRL